ncbi:protein NLRC3-like [Antennarius striatus]|uniref:protein NLRC3-like n=1 Tax=Antennarius striatus TaxID=241820 RepID=UPI0035AF545E
MSRREDGAVGEHEIKNKPERSSSAISMHSMDPPIVFLPSTPSKPQLQLRSDSPKPSCRSAKSDQSKGLSPEFGPETPLDMLGHEDNSSIDGEIPPQQFNLGSIFKQLEDNIAIFAKNELKWFQKVLSSDIMEHSESQCEDDDRRRRTSSKEAFLKIALDTLRAMKQENLADVLQMKTVAPVFQSKLKSNITKKFQRVSEGIPKAGTSTLLNQIFTELYITEGGVARFYEEHECTQIEAKKTTGQETTIRCEDIFKVTAGRDEPSRLVMTKGVAGIGKTVLTEKFSLDWAEGKANQDIQFVFPFTFRELNVLREKKYSLVELVQQLFSGAKEAGIYRFEEFWVVFIFDGLDECRLPLDFTNNEMVTDVTKSTSIDVLLTNLIEGNLLPSARVWITSRPAAANQIPPKCVDMVTEVRGFADPQKEEYFKKRFRDEKQASRIISHIKTSRSLQVMCQIPIFCWITASVLEDEIKTGDKDLPKTLTEMYIHFLVVQLIVKGSKWDRRAETNPLWNEKNRKMIASLGKLAFNQLQHGNLIFYESDLGECDIDIKEASVYSGLVTQIFREERGLYQDKVFCFVHLSVQEFLAALHVHQTFINNGVNLLEEQTTKWWSGIERVVKSKLAHFYEGAVNKALQSPNGHLDLFLRFLLGLSLRTNQSLLQGLLKQTKRGSDVSQNTIKYIKKIIFESLSERYINLFHCLNELRDHSLEDDIQQYLSSGSLCTEKFTPAQWSTLVFILVSSENVLDVFDLRKYGASEEALLRLLPVVKTSKIALMNGCKLTWKSCEALMRVLSCQPSSLRELDLSNNDLQDEGVMLLSSGLKSPHCTLEVLRLSGCLVTKEGCMCLVSALRSNPSHLRELDLSYNHPGDSGMAMLSVILDDPNWRLETLRIENCGEMKLAPGMRKFGCKLTLDPDTAYRKLKLSDDNKTVETVKEYQPYPDHPDRFDYYCQLLCTNELTGRCIWEVEWTGAVTIAVTYRGIRRKGNGISCSFGKNRQSWSLTCSSAGYSVSHNLKVTLIRFSSVSNRAAVYVDCPAGTLSFFEVSNGNFIPLHTFNTTFTEPVYPGFGIGIGMGIPSSGSVTLCDT